MLTILSLIPLFSPDGGDAPESSAPAPDVRISIGTRTFSLADLKEQAPARMASLVVQAREAAEAAQESRAGTVDVRGIDADEAAELKAIRERAKQEIASVKTRFDAKRAEAMSAAEAEPAEITAYKIVYGVAAERKLVGTVVVKDDLDRFVVEQNKSRVPQHGFIVGLFPSADATLTGKELHDLTVKAGHEIPVGRFARNYCCDEHPVIEALDEAALRTVINTPRASSDHIVYRLRRAGCEARGIALPGAPAAPEAVVPEAPTE